MKIVLVSLMASLLMIIISCGQLSQTNPIQVLSEDQRDNLNKVYCDCACSGERKEWLVKSKKATVNANDVLIRWHPFSPKIVGVADSGDTFEVYAYYNLVKSSFGLLTKDTVSIQASDTLNLKKGRRLHWLWYDTVEQTVKVKIRRIENDAPFFPKSNDSSDFFIVLKKNQVEFLPDTKWFYVRTKDDSDACILERYLKIED